MYEESDVDEDEGSSSSSAHKKKRRRKEKQSPRPKTQKNKKKKKNELSPVHQSRNHKVIKNPRIRGSKSRNRKTQSSRSGNKGNYDGEESQSEEDNAIDESLLTLMVCEARVAVNDVGPHMPPRRPFLYWASVPKSDCVNMLMDRCRVRF